MKTKDDIIKEVEQELILNFFPLYLRESGESIVGLEEGIPPINNLPRVSKEDNETLKKIHLCLTDEIKKFRDDLESFLRNIRHTTSNILIINKGQVRGRIDWKLTIQNRYREGFNDTTLFCCRESNKEYTIPENILLKKLVIEIKKIINETELLKGIKPESEQQKKWTHQISLLKKTIDCVEKNVYFKQIDISRIDFNIKSPKFKSIIIKSRQEFYRKTLLDAYILWEKLMAFKISKETDEYEEFVKEIIQRTLIGTKDDNEKYELYALWKILEIFQNKIENIKPLGLRGDEIAWFELKDKEIKVTIYYQTLPEEFKGKIYKKIISYYKMVDNPRSRLPDIIMKFEKAGKKTEYLILEVKYSDGTEGTEARAYILDSIYKVLGYLKDFYFEESGTKKDAILLVVNWAESEDITSQVSTEVSLPIKVLKYDNYKDRIKEIIINFEDSRQFINI